MYMCVYIYIYIYTCMYIYIYIYIEREREREIYRCYNDKSGQSSGGTTRLTLPV